MLMWTRPIQYFQWIFKILLEILIYVVEILISQFEHRRHDTKQPPKLSQRATQIQSHNDLKKIDIDRHFDTKRLPRFAILIYLWTVLQSPSLTPLASYVYIWIWPGVCSTTDGLTSVALSLVHPLRDRLEGNVRGPVFRNHLNIYIRLHHDNFSY